MFEKVLIANRGEIAIRVIRTLKEMGIGAIAVYSEADRDARHVREADEAYLLGPAVPAESYLNIEKILEVAAQAGANAIHPGYGFLAENAPFARAIGETDITWIGPPADAIDAMGSKTRAREIMQKAGVPIVPGATEPSATVEDARKLAEEIGYPIACKAAGGGGGKGFRVALSADDLESAFEGAAREGEKFFGDATVYLERYLEDPRHVEVQVLADSHGNVIHLGERDCSIQRRHQKLIEEAPAPHVDEEMRERIGKIATDAAEAVDYRGAGTVEGMQVGDDYFFLEMNTRVQVEHCVTEMVTGHRHRPRAGADRCRRAALDLPGRDGDARPRDRVPDQRRGRPQEVRTRPRQDRRTTSSRRAPASASTPDSRAGGEVTPLYDPMVAKLITWDVDREHATRRMLRALDEYVIEGLTTLIPFHETILATEQWAKGETCRDLLEDPEWIKSLPADVVQGAPIVDEDEPELIEREYKVEVGGRLYPVKVIGEALGIERCGRRRRPGSARRSGSARRAARPPRRATTSSPRSRAASSRSRSPRATRSRRAP